MLFRPHHYLHPPHLPRREPDFYAMRMRRRPREQRRHHAARELAGRLILLLHDVHSQAGLNLGAVWEHGHTITSHDAHIIDGMTNATRISATLPPDLTTFLDEYQQTHRLDSRSAALAEAIRALRDRELHSAYAELGAAQQAGRETYPADNADGLDTL